MKINISEVRKIIRDQILFEYRNSLNEADADADADSDRNAENNAANAEKTFDDYIPDRAAGGMYRQWANSTSELSAQWGKESTHDLDARGRWNNRFIKASVNAGGGAAWEESKAATELDASRPERTEGWTGQLTTLLSVFEAELEDFGDSPEEQAAGMITQAAEDPAAMVDLILARRALNDHLDQIFNADDPGMFESVSQALKDADQPSFFESMGQIAAIGYGINERFKAKSEELWEKISDLKNSVQEFESGALRRIEMDGWDTAEEAWEAMTSGDAAEAGTDALVSAATDYDMKGIEIQSEFDDLLTDLKTIWVSNGEDVIDGILRFRRERYSSDGDDDLIAFGGMVAASKSRLNEYFENIDRLHEELREMHTELQNMDSGEGWANFEFYDDETPWRTSNGGRQVKSPLIAFRGALNDAMGHTAIGSLGTGSTSAKDAIKSWLHNITGQSTTVQTALASALNGDDFEWTDSSWSWWYTGTDFAAGDEDTIRSGHQERLG